MLALSHQALADRLRGRQLRHRTGVLLLSPEHVGEEANIAAYVGAAFLDLREWKLSRLPQGCRFLGLAWESLVNDLAIALDEVQDRSCVLAANVDLFLALLPYSDRHSFWSFLRETFRPGGELSSVLHNGEE
jgi:hypothetical protein